MCRRARRQVADNPTYLTKQPVQALTSITCLTEQGLGRRSGKRAGGYGAAADAAEPSQPAVRHRGRRQVRHNKCSKVISPPKLHWGTCVIACPNGHLGKQQLTLDGCEQQQFHLLARSIAALLIEPLLLIGPCADHSSCQFMGGTKEHWLQDFAAHYIHRESLLEGQKYEVLAQDCMHVILTFYVLTCAMHYLIPAPYPSAAGLVISSNRWVWSCRNVRSRRGAIYYAYAAFFFVEGVFILLFPSETLKVCPTIFLTP